MPERPNDFHREEMNLKVKSKGRLTKFVLAIFMMYVCMTDCVLMRNTAVNFVELSPAHWKRRSWIWGGDSWLWYASKETGLAWSHGNPCIPSKGSNKSYFHQNEDKINVVSHGSPYEQFHPAFFQLTTWCNTRMWLSLPVSSTDPCRWRVLSSFYKVPG